MSSLIEKLTAQWYLWERRGRGWDVFDRPVELEPPFIPFGFHGSGLDTEVMDDGRHHSAISTLIEWFQKGKASRSIGLAPRQKWSQEPGRIPFDGSGHVKELEIIFPDSLDASSECVEHFLLSLSSSAHPVSFEIIGTQQKISVQIGCRESDASDVKQNVRTFFPDAHVVENQITTSQLLGSSGITMLVDCGLSEEFMRPIRSYDSFDPDPLAALFSVLERVTDQDMGLAQVLFQPVRSPWASSVLRSVQSNDGEPFFLDAPEMTKLAREKVTRPLFAVVIRLVGRSNSKERACEIARSLYSSLNVFSDPLSNEFIPLTNDDYDPLSHFEDLILRRSRRSGMILNSRELLGLVHPPSQRIRSAKLQRHFSKTQRIPQNLTGHSFILGENLHQGETLSVSLPLDVRLKHVHIIGKTGTGKSTLLANMVRQDIEEGRGVAVLDPHGDLVDRVTEMIPENRLNDTILFDPSLHEQSVGFNLLETHSEIEKTVLQSDLTGLFRRYTTSWGDQMTAVLTNAIGAIVESHSGGTLFELKQFLLEKKFRSHLLSQGVDPLNVYFWEKEFPLLRGSSQMSILTRLNGFLQSRIIRDAVARRGGLNFGEIIESRMIFLAKLPQGIIGEENSHLLGSFICSKLHQVVMARQSTQQHERTPYFCYLDEFQHFATSSMTSMLSGSRKYAFGLVMAHQDLHQIADPELANSVISNPATRICFSLGDNDAQKLKAGFAHFDSRDLMNLGTGEAIARVERNEQDFNLKAYAAPPIPNDIAVRKRESIIIRMKGQYRSQHDSTDLLTHRSTPRMKASAANLEQVGWQSHPQINSTIPEMTPSQAESLDGSRSQSQHRYLQTLVKKMAEQRGYRAILEERTPDGKGRVDVALERGGNRIAVEVSVTTGERWEYHNIEKCLSAGYDPVIVCSPETRSLEAIRKVILQKLPLADQGKILLLVPEELFQYLNEDQCAPSSTEKRVRGYRVKVQYHTPTDMERTRKEGAVAQVIMQALRRLRRQE